MAVLLFVLSPPQSAWLGASIATRAVWLVALVAGGAGLDTRSRPVGDAGPLRDVLRGHLAGMGYGAGRRKRRTDPAAGPGHGAGANPLPQAIPL